MTTSHSPVVCSQSKTSAVTAFAGMSDIRHIPLFAVGEATAAHAAALGFTHIQSASGNALALAAYVQTHCDPAQGPLLYLQGNDISHDIITPLSQAGFAAQAVTLYRANTATALSPQLCKAIADRNIAAIMFFSARTASVYAKLALRHCLHDAHTGMTALCLSGNIASKLHALPWKNIRIADCPDTLHMLEITGKLFSADASGT